MDPDTLSCYECEAAHSKEAVSGVCSHMVLGADHAVNDKHDDCTGSLYNAEPSMGSNGAFCVCYKDKAAKTEMVGASKWVIPEEAEENDDEEDEKENKVVFVWNDDLKSGTYRITSSGTYKMMEDIEFAMNGDVDVSPNEEGQWYPRSEQEPEYEGSGGSFVGPYAMGFFAGFAIEADDVVLDLNGFSLSMSAAFHAQQRWFSVIEIGSKPFIPGQGPSNFGPYIKYAQNVVIRNGMIGRSSHHGIHGNAVQNVLIRDVVIRDFEVAGISLNGFMDLTLQNVEIGPFDSEYAVGCDALRFCINITEYLFETEKTVFFEVVTKVKQLKNDQNRKC